MVQWSRFAKCAVEIRGADPWAMISAAKWTSCARTPKREVGCQVHRFGISNMFCSCLLSCEAHQTRALRESFESPTGSPRRLISARWSTPVAGNLQGWKDTSKPGRSEQRNLQLGPRPLARQNREILGMILPSWLQSLKTKSWYVLIYL